MKLIERFESLIAPEPNTGCWLWTGELNKSGYGEFPFGGMKIAAYRLSFYLYKGQIPPRLSVCHFVCDQPICCNPAHLCLGTHAENMRDCSQKGRFHLGQENGSVKLTEQQVLAIVELYGTGNHSHHSLAKQFGVGKTAIGDILLGNRWNHITKIKPVEPQTSPFNSIQDYGPTLIDEFEASIAKQENGCWLWQGELLSTGYGAMKLGSSVLLAHRVSYELFNGEITDGLFVCHACDQKRCVAPPHLWLGTQKDNIADAVKKGIIPCGERSSGSKLTAKQVEEMLALYSTGEYSQEDVATMFGITRTGVSNILHGKIWKHLDIDRSFRKSNGSPGDKNPSRLHPENLARGENHPRTKISDAIVAEIRGLYPQLTQKALSQRFNISETQIGRIVRGESRVPLPGKKSK